MIPNLQKIDPSDYFGEKYELRIRIGGLRQNSMIEPRFSEASLDTFIETKDNKRIKSIAKTYVDKFNEMAADGQGLLLYGPVGTGKSYTAAAIANALIDNGYAAVMTTFVNLLQTGDYSDEAAVINKRMNGADLLIIDDLGAERSTDYALEKVYNIIDGRYRTGRPLILTTNLEVSQMKNTTDIRYTRIYDRIFEMCYPVKFVGLSWRKREAVVRFEKMKNLLEGKQ